MKTQRPYPALTITPKGERALVDGHPWVYAGEVTQVPEGTEDGALVDVLSRKGSYLGTGATRTTALTARSGRGACSTHGTTARP